MLSSVFDLALLCCHGLKLSKCFGFLDAREWHEGKNNSNVSLSSLLLSGVDPDPHVSDSMAICLTSSSNTTDSRSILDRSLFIANGDQVF